MLGRGGAGLGRVREAKVGQRAFRVPMGYDPRALDGASVEDGGSLRPQLRELDSASLAAPAEARQYEDSSVVELAVLVDVLVVLVPSAHEVDPSLRDAGQPRPPAGSRAVREHAFDLGRRPFDRPL